MATSTRTRITALITAMAITMTACGGTTDEVDSQAQIDELQAQIEDLQSTTAAPIEEAAPEEAPTTTAPVEETIEVTATTAAPAAEETATTTAAPVEETADEQVAAPVTAAGFATPTGSVLNSTMGPAQAKDLFAELLGSTNDYTGQISRVAPFPALTTLPDTDITSMNLTLRLEEVDQVNVGYSFTSRFDTTAGAQDAVTAYTAELLTFHGGEVDQFTTEDDDYGTVYWSTVAGDEYGDEYQIVAYEYQGLTTVSTKYDTLDGGVPAELASAIDGIRTHLPLEGDPAVSRFVIMSDPFAQTFAVALHHETSIEETQGYLDAAVAQAGWTPFEGFQADWESPAHDGLISAEVVQVGDNPAYIQTQYAWR